MNLLDIHECPGYLGPMKHESPGYLGHMKCYSPDIRESPGYSGPMKLESPGYLGPLTHKPPVYLRISEIFGARITCIFANHLDICKSHKYSGPKGARISSIFSNLLDILVSPGNLESPG